MKKIILSTLVASSLLIASEYKYEVTPMAGYVDTKEHVDIDNQKVAGVSVAKNMDADCKFDQLEIGLLQTLGDEDYENSTATTYLTRIFADGVKDLYSFSDKLKLYGLVGLGYEYIENRYFRNESGTFANYGVGLKYAINDTLSLKFDVRHLLKFDGDRDVIYTFGVAIPFGKKAVKEITPKPVPKKVEKVKPVTLPAVVAPKDGDNDGVIDKLDQCPTTKVGVKVDKKGCAILNKPESLGVLFDTNSATIKSIDQEKFDKYVSYLKRVPTAIVIIEGHTDSIGSEKYNLILSQKRANSVKEKLISMGVDSNRIKAIGYGETQPVVPNDTAEHRQINRRVTARIKN